MVGNEYWAVGIELVCSGNTWKAFVEFLDAGGCDENSTNGTLYTRYYVALETAIDILMADVERLGIKWHNPMNGGPSLYYKGGGEWEGYPPPEGWRETLAEQAARIGWRKEIS